MLEDQFHFQLLKCFNHQKRWINQRTIQIDVLPGQSKVLQCLDEHGPLSPKEIGKLCIVDKSTTTSLLNKMEKMNYIEKKNQNHDSNRHNNGSSQVWQLVGQKPFCQSRIIINDLSQPPTCILAEIAQ